MNAFENDLWWKKTAKRFFKDRDFPLWLSIQDPQTATFSHIHEFSELVVVSAGEGFHHIGKNDYHIRCGDVFVIREGVSHYYRDPSGLALINLLFDPKTLPLQHYDIDSLHGYHALFTIEPQARSSGGANEILHLSDDEQAIVNSLLHQLNGELRGEKDGYKFMAMGLFMQIVAFLSRCYARRDTPSAKNILRLSPVISYLSDNLHEDIRVEDLAERNHMSVSTLSRLFRKYLKHSPIDYLLRLRIARAAELLLSTDANISEIAYQCGFHDSNYFSRIFRSMMDMSPRDYRAEK